MNKKKIAILGASYLQKPLFEKAKEMGVNTIAFLGCDGGNIKGMVDIEYIVPIFGLLTDSNILPIFGLFEINILTIFGRS